MSNPSLMDKLLRAISGMNDSSLSASPGILERICIIDLSMGWAGPLATRHLADLGVDVIKVEGLERFDWWRSWEATEE